jgi:hypothetical protein
MSALLVPPAVTALRTTTPAACRGSVAWIWVSESRFMATFAPFEVME